MRNTAPTWYNATVHPVTLDADFATPLMTYAEVQFILSEYKGFSAAEYEAAVPDIRCNCLSRNKYHVLTRMASR